MTEENINTTQETEIDYKSLHEQLTNDMSRLRLLNMADLENARKAYQKDLHEHIKYANEKLILSIMPLMDTFDIALQYAKDEQTAKPINMLKGQFLQVLSKHNVSIIPCNIGDMFDADLHEALETVENADMTDNQIAKIEQTGYKLQNRIVRATRVTVVKN